MTSIITGDIINSKMIAPSIWMPLLKQALSWYGSEPMQWEIYRGDSFQLEINPEKALEAAILIKATVKNVKELDVRLAIGVGDKIYNSEKITTSNGTAFVNSGECFENLKKSTLGFKSADENLNIQLNLLFDLAQLTMNSWTQKSSEIVKTVIENPNLNQKELAKILNKTQSAISKNLKIAGFDEIMRMETYYRKLITTL
ncbi:SatD family protein [Lutibacter sp. TH_r2]|uniref:SatD family protein n=1 Tax=Lutibacter sp. TH_r2 TaxID=3082083 RepID=UPI002953F1B8|nr:SatD family protein [Lutibacter sp. TH_r2]MDV7188237.1 SatD family protein [Lutibacter sp. TH_r2]